MRRDIERRLLLDRLFYRNDKDLYKLGKNADIPWFRKFSSKFEKDAYAYFSEEEKLEAIERIVAISSDIEFANVLNLIFKEKERYLTIDRFVGEHYFYDSTNGIVLENRQEQIRDDVKNALADTKGRGYYFLKSIIDLHREDKWDSAYGGAAWIDILVKTREIEGPYPAPRDMMLLKSYRLYYKTGSRRYPTHTVPEEIIPVVEEIITQYQKDIEN
jgi:hypothetical protein